MKKIFLAMLVCTSIFTAAVAKDVTYFRKDGNITVVSHGHDWSGNHTIKSSTMNRNEYNDYAAQKMISDFLVWILKAIFIPSR